MQLVGLYTNQEGRDVAYVPQNHGKSQNVDWAFVTPAGQFRRIFYPTDGEVEEMRSIPNEERYSFIEVE